MKLKEEYNKTATLEMLKKYYMKMKLYPVVGQKSRLMKYMIF